MQEIAPIPHGWQLVYLAVASVLSSVGTLVVDRFIKRKREPVEIDKIRVETRNLYVSTELETLREIRELTQKAHERNEDWLLKEEQLRTQILFWRNKAEELDGDVVGLKFDVAQLETRYTKKDHELKGALALLLKHEISYAELDQPREK